MKATDLLPIGDLARRTGLSVSAIRFYETHGLIGALRTRGGQRRFPRSDIRRLSFIMIAQRLGLSLDEIGAELGRLPDGRTPSRADWAAISRRVREAIDARIADLCRIRDNLDGCIGCGCLSIDRCQLYNRADKASVHGAGPRWTMGNRASETPETEVS